MGFYSADKKVVQMETRTIVKTVAPRVYRWVDWMVDGLEGLTEPHLVDQTAPCSVDWLAPQSA